MWDKIKSLLKPTEIGAASRSGDFRPVSGYAEDMERFETERALPESNVTPLRPKPGVKSGAKPTETRKIDSPTVSLSLPVPPGVSQPSSWIGGRPRLPRNIEWPTHDGVPCMFLAQISCTELPSPLWGGAGPRTGWLAFFVGEKNANYIHVMHVAATGPERAPPKGTSLQTGWCNSRFGRAPVPPDLVSFDAPRWPIRIDPITPKAIARSTPSPAQKYARDDNPRWTAELSASPSDHTYEPFDRPSARLYLRSAQLWCKQALDRLPTGDGARQGTLDASVRYRRAIVEIDTLERALEGVAGTQSFSLAAWYPLFDRLCQMADPSVADTPEVPAPGIVETSGGAQGWLVCYDRLRADHAKKIYATDPAALPDPVRAHYETLWSFDARHETARMGGLEQGDVGMQSAVLLQLPTSELMGWSFGDLDSLKVTVPIAGLERLDFSGARMSIIEPETT